MRTTLALDDELLTRLKQRAAAEQRSMQELVNDLLRFALSTVSRKGAYKLELKGWRAEQQPGADISDRDRLFDLMGER